MAIVKTEAGDGVVLRPPETVTFFLLHGSDQGLVHERASRLVKALTNRERQAPSVVRVEGETLGREPGWLQDEAKAVDMFSGSKVIWIDGNQRDLSPALAPLFESPPPDCSIVLEAGSLKKGTSVRVLFEQSAIALSIECYADERNSLQALIEEEANRAHLEVAADVRAYLASLLGADRLTSRGEVAKLMVYCQGLGRVDASDVEAIVSNATPSSAERLISAAILGNLSEVEMLASRYFDDDGEPGVLVLRMISSLDLLHELKLSGSSGRGSDSLPPAFFRLPPSQRAWLTEAARFWTAEAVRQRLLWSREVLAKVRGQQTLARSVATRALWALASAGRSRRR